MWKMISNWFKPIPNPYIGMFRGWNADRYTASSPDGQFAVWIANGFYGFQDDTITMPKRQLLATATSKERRLMWHALQHDLNQDNLDRLNAQKIEDVK